MQPLENSMNQTIIPQIFTDREHIQPGELLYDDFCKMLSERCQQVIYERKENRRFEMNHDTELMFTELYKFITSKDYYWLLISGHYGTGKTITISAFFKLWNWYYDNYKLPLMAYRTSGDLFRKLIDKPDGYDKRPLIIDELGREPKKAQYFGNIIFPLCEMFLTRYSINSITIATSNYKLSTLCSNEYYGEMIGDRFGQMFRNVELTGKSLR